MAQRHYASKVTPSDQPTGFEAKPGLFLAEHAADVCTVSVQTVDMGRASCGSSLAQLSSSHWKTSFLVCSKVAPKDLQNLTMYTLTKRDAPKNTKPNTSSSFEDFKIFLNFLSF